MTTKIKISIPEPCHENWFDMSQTEKGKFCSACQKNVIDFTKSSDREIVLAFNENDKLCGRFNNSQINRNLVIQKEKKSICTIAAASLIAFLGLGNQTAQAQGKIRIEQTSKKTSEINPSIDSENEEIEIEGRIFLEEANPNFEEVNIFIDGKNPVFHPDSEGRFCIKANKGTIISIYKDGYINYSTKVYNYYIGAIELEKENCKEKFIVGGAIAVKRSFWYRLFHKN
ncbi:hypothetical protein [Flavobacterium ajazii]|uniref:hypothetical protein n=1 Tax=Flavobacterium ajazii TaxID=2692318 RepID=UPI0013D00F2B|nr:hypothetical protein [Flavobacterium ajazii]